MENPVEKIDIYLSSLNRQKVVVGLEGYSGTGKTTIAKELSRKDQNIHFINSDSYSDKVNPKEFIIKENLNSPEKIVDQYVELQQTEIIGKDIKKIKEGVVLVEARFILHGNFRDLFDKVIYLSSDFDKADIRREKREKDLMGEKYDKKLAKLFSEYFRAGYEYYVSTYKPEKNSDLVVNF